MMVFFLFSCVFLFAEVWKHCLQYYYHYYYFNDKVNPWQSCGCGSVTGDVDTKGCVCDVVCVYVCVFSGLPSKPRWRRSAQPARSGSVSDGHTEEAARPTVRL